MEPVTTQCLTIPRIPFWDWRPVSPCLRCRLRSSAKPVPLESVITRIHQIAFLVEHIEVDRSLSRRLILMLNLILMLLHDVAIVA